MSNLCLDVERAGRSVVYYTGEETVQCQINIFGKIFSDLEIEQLRADQNRVIGAMHDLRVRCVDIGTETTTIGTILSLIETDMKRFGATAVFIDNLLSISGKSYKFKYTSISII